MLPSWVSPIINNPLLEARIKAGIASASVFAGGWTMSHMYDWLTAHATFFTQATDMAIAGTVSACVAGLVISAIGILYPQKDVANVDAKIKVAAATGDAAAADNAALVAQAKAGAAVTP